MFGVATVHCGKALIIHDNRVLQRYIKTLLLVSLICLIYHLLILLQTTSSFSQGGYMLWEGNNSKLSYAAEAQPKDEEEIVTEPGTLHFVFRTKPRVYF